MPTSNSRFIAPLLVVLVLVATLFVWRFAPWTKQAVPISTGESDRLRVTATISPLADMVKNIGGERVDVTVLLPPGASPHAFEPSVQQAVAAQESDLVFSIGHGFDDWAKPLIAGSRAELATPDAGIALRDLSAQERDADEPDQKQDPHYWLSVPNAAAMSRDIAAILAKKDPSHAQTYADNLAAYLVRLSEADKYVRDRLKAIKNTKLLTHHNAWGYFAQEYGLTVVGTFEVSPGKEPTVRQLADLQATVTTHGLKTVYVEPQLSKQSVLPFVHDLNLRIATLDPEGGSDNLGYAQLMRYNADTIAENQ